MEAVKENKMGTLPVNRLIISMSVPMMISMLVQALYNIVDSIYVSQINENALTAVSLIFPVQTLMIAFGTGLGVGFSSLLSRSLGEKKQDLVDKSALNGLFLEVCAGIMFFIIGLTLPDFFMRSQTDNAEIVEYGIQYMSIICRCSIFLFFQMSFERLMQATGKTLFTMITQTIGAVINIVMDPILIFGLYGLPRLGVRGAAIATIFGQSIAGILALIFNLTVNKEVHFRLKGFRPEPAVIKEIFNVGIPSIFMQAIGSVMTYGMNRILITFTTTATAVFGVYFKINSFIFMPVFGLNNGLVPILAYNFGAGKKSRLNKAFRLGLVYAVTILTLGTVLFLTLPGFFLSLFNASDEMLGIGVPALRIICLSFPLAAFSIICGSLFQALGNGVYSLITSFIRQLIVLLPSAYVLSLTGVLQNVWWSYVIAEFFALVMSSILLKRLYRLTIGKMQVKE